MAIETRTNIAVLMRLAFAVGNAKKTNDPVLIAKAEYELAEYEELVKKSDRMDLNVKYGDLL